MDPLPILGGANNKTEDDESLESMVESKEDEKSDKSGLDHV
jgi:hypothetical protein